MTRTANIVFLIIILMSIRVLSAVQVPFFLDWRSSDAYRFNNLTDSETAGLAYLYKVNAGVDTTFSNGLKTRLELTNEEKGLNSQALIKEAVISYQAGNYGLELAMKDFGYGNGFFYYNRRNEDVYFDRNALIEYRWNGLELTRYFRRNKVIAGFGINSRNRVITNLGYNYQCQMADISLFGIYVMNDSRYTLETLNGGSELKFYFNSGEFHSAFNYQYTKQTNNFPEENSWHFINELNLKISERFRAVLSSDLKKESEFDEIKNAFEICTITNYNRFNSNLGIRTQSIFSERLNTYFLDLNYNPVNSAILGIYFDYADFTHSGDYYKVGLQTRFSLR